MVTHLVEKRGLASRLSVGVPQDAESSRKARDLRRETERPAARCALQEESERLTSELDACEQVQKVSSSSFFEPFF